jgi:FMN phosphatase YigB (HAD superfamily)
MDVIFDVDGTLLNIEHRVPLIRPKDGSKKDWEAFRNKACDDVPHVEIVEVARALSHAKHRLIVCTGRMEKERAVTHASLLAAGFPMYSTPMYMRKNDDVRADHIIKLEMIVQLRAHGFEPCLVFDDRQQVVDMWRKLGLRVCQVAPGDF